MNPGQDSGIGRDPSAHRDDVLSLWTHAVRLEQAQPRVKEVAE
jgi:hypothetical protein